MGRYAFFNTTLEYKFAFAVQPSSDMLMFGGSEMETKDEEDFGHSWTKDDLPEILETLEIISKFCCIPLPNFETYEKNLEGTQTMRNEIDKKIKEPLDYRFLLGCIIYHQLTYMDPLTVNYEG
jgi:hypothetical protein